MQEKNKKKSNREIFSIEGLWHGAALKIGTTSKEIKEIKWWHEHAKEHLQTHTPEQKNEIAERILEDLRKMQDRGKYLHLQDGKKFVEYFRELESLVAQLQGHSQKRENVQILTENWESQFASLLADIFLSPGAREEWLGDLYENRQDLIIRGRPRWVIILATLITCIQMGWALFSIKYQDLISSKKERQVK